MLANEEGTLEPIDETDLPRIHENNFLLTVYRLHKLCQGLRVRRDIQQEVLRVC